jgi:hypothetical protein
MEKLIIENRASLSMSDAIQCVNAVINMGKISTTNSKKHYCHHTVLHLEGIKKEVHVSAFVNKKSDKLIIHHNDGIDYREKNNE